MRTYYLFNKVNSTVAQTSEYDPTSTVPGPNDRLGFFLFASAGETLEMQVARRLLNPGFNDQFDHTNANPAFEAVMRRFTPYSFSDMAALGYRGGALINRTASMSRLEQAFAIATDNPPPAWAPPPIPPPPDPADEQRPGPDVNPNPPGILVDTDAMRYDSIYERAPNYPF